MAKAERFILTEDMAQKAMKDIIHEVWSYYPIKVDIRLTAAVDEVPEFHVEYDTRLMEYYIGEVAEK